MGTISEDMTFRGVVAISELRASGIVRDSTVEAAAGIQASKLEHEQRPVYEQESATTAFAETRVVHVASGSGTLQDIQAGAVTPNQSGATVDIDLLVNGSSVLSSTITLTDTETAYELVTGSFSSTSLSAGDVLEIDVTVNAGTGTLAQGVFCYVTLDEDYS